MRKHLKSLIAVTIATGGFGFLVSNHWAYGQAYGGSSDTGTNVQSQDNMTAGQSSTQLPPGIQQGQATDAKDIQTTLANVADAAATKNNLDKVTSYFVDSDRNRLSNDVKNLANEPTLNGRIDQFQKDWQSKYNKSFSVDPQVAFGQQFQGFTIVQGQVTNPAMLSNWPVPNQGAAGQAGQQGGQAGQPNIQQGQQVAIATFPASHGLPDVTVSMVKEGNQWRINIPDNVDAKQLHDNLLTQLTSLDEQKNQWPNDVNEASRLATHRILVGIYGVSTAQGMQPQRMMIQPQEGQQQKQPSQQQPGQHSEQH
ncbi:MAG: hypothetical protein ACM359_17810 [Bacillota bacterium]